MTDERQRIITVLEKKLEELKIMSDEEYAAFCKIECCNFYREFIREKTIGESIRCMTDDELAELINTICVELEESGGFAEWDRANGKKCWKMWLGWEYKKPLRPWWNYGFRMVKK